jgi:hypothetical protein
MTRQRTARPEIVGRLAALLLATTCLTPLVLGSAPAPTTMR